VIDEHSQRQYQVRFDWGGMGAATVGADADVVIWVDALGASEAPENAVRASLRERTAVARWVVEQQGAKGDRFFVAVIAAGEPRADGSLRFALEDMLAAGGIIDALADVGIDYCSPEAAAVAAAYAGLRSATGHLIGASASGRELAAAGRRAEVDAAIEVDAVAGFDPHTA